MATRRLQTCLSESTKAAIDESAMRQAYAALQPGDRVEVIHRVRIGCKEHASRTVGTVVGKERRPCGVDSGWARNWDDQYWFDHLVLRKDDGELTSLTMDEQTQIQQLEPLSQTNEQAGQEKRP